MRVVVALAGAFVAALFAHIGIDAAGDYLLAHDTYDDHAHNSRYVASVAFLLAVLVAVYVYARAVVAETRGNRGALRAALRSSISASRVAFASIVAGLAMPLLLGMAWLDSLVAGIPVDDVTDLFGGSLALGIGMTVLASLVASLAIRSLVALVARFQRAIVRAAHALVHDAVTPVASDGCVLVRRTDDRELAFAFFTRCPGADRAPPVASIRVRPT